MKKFIWSFLVISVISFILDPIMDSTKSIYAESNKAPIILEDFENGITDWRASGARYNTLNIRQTTYPEPARFGNHALQLDYDFTGTKGTSGAYAWTVDGIILKGYPEAIGMWVYGDGNGHWIRAQLKDGDNKAFSIDFALKADWTGWKYVQAPIPKGKATPLKLDLAFRYMETNDNNKNAGTVYIDNIRAEYGETNDDLINPTITSVYPNDAQILTEDKTEIKVTVIDNEGGSGINPNRVKMKLDGVNIIPNFDKAKNEFSYYVTKLADGEHKAYIKVEDNFGNPVEKSWTFKNETGGPILEVNSSEKIYAGNTFPIDISTLNRDGLHSASFKYAFDPKLIQIIDQDPLLEGTQLELGKEINKDHVIKNEVNNETGEIIFEVENINGADGLLTRIIAEVAPNADQEINLNFISGSIILKNNLSKKLPIQLPSINKLVHFNLELNYEGIALNTPTTFTITDENKQPVSNTEIRIINDKNKIILGITNEQGQLITNELNLAIGKYKVQAVKDHMVSKQTEIEVKPPLGNEKPENLTLTWEKDPKTTQNFTWRTSPQVKQTIVQIIDEDDEPDFTDNDMIEIKGTNHQFETDIGVMQIHKAIAQDLEPGETYKYRVGNGEKDNWSAVGTFTTEDKDDEPFSFLFISDTQAIPNASALDGYGIWGEIFGKGLQTHPDAKFMLLSGDIVDYGDKQIHWEHWFDAAKAYLPNINMVPVLGNHDVVGSGTENFKEQFQLPRNGPEGEVEQAYSFDYSNTHIAVLNSEGDLEKQAEWLIDDMNKSDKLWKIVSFHRSPYHSHESRGSADVRNAWTPAFDKAGIDLVLSGHDHAYMRSWPIYDGKIVEEGKGTTYIIGGSAGPKFYEMGDQGWMRVKFNENIQIYSGITIDEEQLNFTVTARDGRTADAFTMIKSKNEYKQYQENMKKSANQLKMEEKKQKEQLKKTKDK